MQLYFNYKTPIKKEIPQGLDVKEKSESSPEHQTT